jgi:hypothetical protein
MRLNVKIQLEPMIVVGGFQRSLKKNFNKPRGDSICIKCCGNRDFFEAVLIFKKN